VEHDPGPSRSGSVVLDIGGDIGAAVVRAPASLAGVEIEIRRMEDPWEGRHVSVRARHVAPGVVHAAVFEALERGSYEVRVRGGAACEPPCTFEIVGGRVTERELVPQCGGEYRA
jgi:hypothetical protein